MDEGCVFSSATQLEQLLNVDFPPLIKRLNQAIGSLDAATQ
jgi:hypothetical protein